MKTWMWLMMLPVVTVMASKDTHKGTYIKGGGHGIQSNKTKGGHYEKASSCRFATEKEGITWDGPKTIYLSESKAPVDVYCRDMDKQEGGWTVIQRRFDGSEDFDRDWFDYKGGFGEVGEGEYWVGNENIHMMTEQDRQILRIELTDWKDKVYIAEFEDFRIGSETENYKVKKLGKVSGNAGSALMDAQGQGFSTKKFDHDQWKAGDCAQKRRGGWWFGAGPKCSGSYLNGPYKKGSAASGDPGIQWTTGHYAMNPKYSYKKSEMMLKNYYQIS